MLEIRNLNVCMQQKSILRNINLKLKPHSFTAIIGKNGCGKSTLVSCVNQMQNYTGGILFNGNSLALMHPRERARLISVLPQVLKTPHIRVEDLVKMGRNPYVDMGHHLTDNDWATVHRGMEIIGIESLKDCFIDEISGGERQKAYLAMTIAQDTRLLVLDEPTTYMDMAFEREFLIQLEQLKTLHKKTLLVVMHNLNLALTHADHVVVMEKGCIVFDGSREDCLAGDVIEKTFGVRRYEVEGNLFFR